MTPLSGVSSHHKQQHRSDHWGGMWIPSHEIALVMWPFLALSLSVSLLMEGCGCELACPREDLCAESNLLKHISIKAEMSLSMDFQMFSLSLLILCCFQFRSVLSIISNSYLPHGQDNTCGTSLHGSTVHGGIWRVMFPIPLCRENSSQKTEMSIYHPQDPEVATGTPLNSPEN